MAQKDISQKLLEDYENVFADIVNVLVFGGKEAVRPEALEPSSIRSQYKAASDGLYRALARRHFCRPVSVLGTVGIFAMIIGERAEMNPEQTGFH